MVSSFCCTEKTPKCCPNPIHNGNHSKCQNTHAFKMWNDIYECSKLLEALKGSYNQATVFYSQLMCMLDKAELQSHYLGLCVRLHKKKWIQCFESIFTKKICTKKWQVTLWIKHEILRQKEWKFFSCRTCSTILLTMCNSVLDILKGWIE